MSGCPACDMWLVCSVCYGDESVTARRRVSECLSDGIDATYVVMIVG